ncbi:MAG: hypothetical protein M3R17_19650 [Bacteroidota bacterium]|nr:hypothetical protein [Bacteroidota bacterium]
MIFNKHAVKLSRILSFLLVFTLLASSLSAQTKKRGKVTTKHANGIKESEGKVKNYKMQGVWKYWSDGGKLEKTITYEDNVKQGLYTEYYSNEKKSVEGNYLLGRKNGTWNTWYNDGTLSSKSNYDAITVVDNSQDFYEGVQQWWYENGQLREQTYYSSHTLIYRQSWYKNGKRRVIENYKDGLAEGTWRKYPEPSESTDTLPASIDNYSKGKKNGVHLGYTRGRLSEEIYYKDDQLHGTFKKWDSMSQLGVSENYVNGKRDGLCRYFNYGRCIREVMYENGRIDGEEKEYDGRGELFRISWYKKGIIDSVSQYHKNGKRAISRTYKYYPGFVKTEEFSDYTEWDSTGVLLLRGTYHFEIKDKDWTTYYANGKVKSITPWSAGKIKGVYKKWYANGKLMIELECDGYNVTAQPKVWDEKGKVIKAGTKVYNEIVESSKPGEIYNDPKKYKENRTEENPPVGVINEEINRTTCSWPWYDEHFDLSPVQAQEGLKEDEVFTFVEVMPSFPGGNDSMKLFLKRNLKYPLMCRDAALQGTVYIAFVVEKDGFNGEALRLVKSMPNWIPGKMNGKPVRTEMTIPIKFILQ